LSIEASRGGQRFSAHTYTPAAFLESVPEAADAFGPITRRLAYAHFPETRENLRYPTIQPGGGQDRRLFRMILRA